MVSASNFGSQDPDFESRWMQNSVASLHRVFHYHSSVISYYLDNVEWYVKHQIIIINLCESFAEQMM